MKYDWDAAKNRSNFIKHGLRFEDAEQVFDGPCVTFVDDRFDYGEERLHYFGLARRTIDRDSSHAARRRNADHLDEKRKPT